MRVIAGEAKGRRLTGPRSARLRPTTDRVREALFSALGAGVAGARVLDLYAGSGALGIEALSRGAASAVFVDADPGAVETVRANLALTGLADRAAVVRQTAERYVATPPAEPFDLVLMDPPYAGGVPSAVLAALATKGFLASEAEVVLEVRDQPDRAGDHPDVGGLRVVSRRRYGDSALVFLRPADPAAGEP
jgi:16S rRNA (guanine966-N2)-methyltransferase